MKGRIKRNNHEQSLVYLRRRPWNREKYRQGRSCRKEGGHGNWHHEGDAPMTAWTSDELNKIGAAEELRIASLRRDGKLRNPVTIWVVRVGDDLYVRSWKGRTGSWFRASQVRHEGHVQAGGVDRDVTFVAGADDDINDQIDAAYRAKYRRHDARWVDPMVSTH